MSRPSSLAAPQPLLPPSHVRTDAGEPELHLPSVVAAPKLAASASEPHLSWRSTGAAKLAAIQKRWEPRAPLRSELRGELLHSHTRQRHTDSLRDATQPHHADVTSRLKAARAAAPDARDEYQSAVLKCEMAVAEALAREQTWGGTAAGAPSSATAEECLAALGRLAELVPPAFRPALNRVAAALEPMVFSSEETDSYGRRLPHAQYVQVVAQRRIADARSGENLAKMQRARAVLAAERAEARAREAEEGRRQSQEQAQAAEKARVATAAKLQQRDRTLAELEKRRVSAPPTT